MLEPNRRRNLKREILLMTKMSHPNLVRMYEAYESKKQVFIVEEYLSGQSLQVHLRRIKELYYQPTGNQLTHTLSQPSLTNEGSSNPWPIHETEVKLIFKQILFGVHYMHQRNIVHRDIKLENILFDETGWKIKLVDFGFSTCLADLNQKLKIFCGTPTYMAPEIVSKEKNVNSLNQGDQGYEAPPADVWALGVVLYTLLCGKFPFKPQRFDQEGKELSKKERNGLLFKMICKEDLPILQDMPLRVSKGPRKLLNSMLIKQPEFRPSTF